MITFFRFIKRPESPSSTCVSRLLNSGLQTSKTQKPATRSASLSRIGRRYNALSNILTIYTAVASKRCLSLYLLQSILFINIYWFMIKKTNSIDRSLAPVKHIIVTFSRIFCSAFHNNISTRQS